ncbi:MAG: hypothetical protein EKK53_01090 [Burkholderiales bacterium]|nr:MAG: hypothetical protein EKK53_01090 [Burkholderiales bacterium]
MDTPSHTTPQSLPQRVGAWWRERRHARERPALLRRCPPATAAATEIPASVRAAWAQQAPDECPGLRVDDDAWLRCSLALAQFFEACRLQQSHGACALPSKAADSVWHVWLATDPASLAAWQQRYFDLAVPHREAAALGAPLDDCLARTWVGACSSEGLSPLGPRLPLVFALDGMLAVPTGWAYRFERPGLVHRDIDGFGRTQGSGVLHAAVAGSALVGMGLLAEAELQAWRRQQASSGGSSCGSGVAASDGGSCDGGSSGDCGGSSCGGSGCGGGGS